MLIYQLKGCRMKIIQFLAIVYSGILISGCGYQSAEDCYLGELEANMSDEVANALRYACNEKYPSERDLKGK
jgi:hypothetical protein